MSTPETSDFPVLSLVIAVEAVKAGPQSFSLEADAREREALAAAYGLVSLECLSAEGTVTRVGRLVEVRGLVEAAVTQECVVTLEPVAGKVREEVAIDFVEPDARPAADPAEGTDPPDVLEGDEIDVGALVEEHLALGLDPYPRAPGAEVPREYRAGEGDADSPFAALSGLADRASGTDNRRKSKD